MTLTAGFSYLKGVEKDGMMPHCGHHEVACCRRRACRKGCPTMGKYSGGGRRQLSGPYGRWKAGSRLAAARDGYESPTAILVSWSLHTELRAPRLFDLQRRGDGGRFKVRMVSSAEKTKHRRHYCFPGSC